VTGWLTLLGKHATRVADYKDGFTVLDQERLLTNTSSGSSTPSSGYGRALKLVVLPL
jgi:hypothetical protein